MQPSSIWHFAIYKYATSMMSEMLSSNKWNLHRLTLNHLVLLSLAQINSRSFGSPLFCRFFLVETLNWSIFFSAMPSTSSCPGEQDSVCGQLCIARHGGSHSREISWQQDCHHSCKFTITTFLWQRIIDFLSMLQYVWHVHTLATAVGVHSLTTEIWVNSS